MGSVDRDWYREEARQRHARAASQAAAAWRSVEAGSRHPTGASYGQGAGRGSGRLAWLVVIATLATVVVVVVRGAPVFEHPLSTARLLRERSRLEVNLAIKGDVAVQPVPRWMQSAVGTSVVPAWQR